LSQFNTIITFTPYLWMALYNAIFRFKSASPGILFISSSFPDQKFVRILLSFVRYFLREQMRWCKARNTISGLPDSSVAWPACSLNR